MKLAFNFALDSEIFTKINRQSTPGINPGIKQNTDYPIHCQYSKQRPTIKSQLLSTRSPVIKSFSLQNMLTSQNKQFIISPQPLTARIPFKKSLTNDSIKQPTLSSAPQHVFKNLQDSEIQRASKLSPCQLVKFTTQLFIEIKQTEPQFIRKVTETQINKFILDNKKIGFQNRLVSGSSILREDEEIQTVFQNKDQISIQNMSIVGDQSDLFHLSLIKWIKGISSKRMDIVEKLRRDVIRAIYYVKNKQLK